MAEICSIFRRRIAVTWAVMRWAPSAKVLGAGPRLQHWLTWTCSRICESRAPATAVHSWHAASRKYRTDSTKAPSLSVRWCAADRDSVMFGEWFNYGDNFGHPGEDYWLVEISGLPFGVFNDMLGSPYPTDPYKGMVFGSWARYGSGETLYPDYHNNTALWAFIAATDLNQSSMIGYWNASSPVRVTAGSNLTQAALCDKVFATSYVMPGVRTVLSVASWADADANCTLTVDYEQLGFTEVQSARARARGLVAMPIDQFQPATRFPSDSELPIDSSKGYFGLSGRQSRPHIQPGWLLVIEPGEGTERASTNGG